MTEMAMARSTTISNRMAAQTYNTSIPALAVTHDELRQVDLSISYLLDHFGHSDREPLEPEDGRSTRRRMEGELSYERASSTAFLELTLFLGPQCNARCPICYTRTVRRTVRTSRLLTMRQLHECVDLAVRHGVKIIYIPGLGEPLLDSRFLPLLELGASSGLRFVVATNGVVFADEAEANRAGDCSCAELIQHCAGMPLTFLHKVWGTTREGLRASLGVAEYPVENVGGIDVPLSIVNMLANGFPTERLAVQAVVRPDNIDEIRAIRDYYGEELGLGLILEETLLVGGGTSIDWAGSGAATALEKYLIRECFRHRVRLTIDHKGNVLNCPASIEQPLFNLFDKMGGSISDKDILPALFADSRWVANKRRCEFTACPQCELGRQHHHAS